MDNKLLFSSKTNEWETPIDLFDKLNKEFHFTLDPCATSKNAKCLKYFTKEIDGLKQNWGGAVFMNPPYSRKTKSQAGQSDWIKKAYEESLKGATVVCLLPVRTDTLAWHEYILPHAEIRFLKGRLKFGDSKNPAPFPSAIVIFNNNNLKGNN